jgi:hypothetical protein
MGTHYHPQPVLELISQLLGQHPFDEAAAILTKRGIAGGRGRPLTSESLAALCRYHGIPGHGERMRAAGMLTSAETAARLGVTIGTVNKWQRAGLLNGHRIDSRGTCLYPPGQQAPSRSRT